ncbi:MAG: hypothetical protein NZL85_09170, partial [Fimbriimonadales bacterium]|nr:hypothetical protein [Fimbriimonadales bacterium]
MRRGWVWLVAVVGLLGRVGLLPLLFWGVHPLWLTAFWGLQGYPATLSDLPRWYEVGVFNAVPALAWLIAGLPLLAVLGLLHMRLPRRRAKVMVGALLGGLIVPPLAYVLLLNYAGIWHYRA